MSGSTVLSAYEARTIARALKVMEKSLVVRDVVFESPAMVRQYLSLRLFNLQHVVFMVLMLDSQNRLIEAQEMFRGTVSQTAVYPREVVKAALNANAASVILAHNHPSGVAEASRADRPATPGRPIGPLRGRTSRTARLRAGAAGPTA